MSVCVRVCVYAPCIKKTSFVVMAIRYKWTNTLNNDSTLLDSEKEWLGALPFSISRLAAPVAMVLNFKIGTWGVLLLGTILTTLGLGLSGLAQNVGILFFTYGSLAAFGMTLLISPPAFLIDQIYPYHHPRHVLATSIALCGSPLGELH